ncbi:MAG: hypothetical protein ABJN04_13710 [Hyphomicrobiales bacterium]
MSKETGNIVDAYLRGLFWGNLIFLPFFGPISIALFFGGFILALPFLLVILILFSMYRDFIYKNLKYLCIFAPFFIAISWVIMSWVLRDSNSGYDFWWFLSLKQVWTQGLLALTCACISSRIFWRRNRRNLF